MIDDPVDTYQLISGKLMDDGRIQLIDTSENKPLEIFDPKTYKAYTNDGKTEIGTLEAAPTGALDSIQLKNGTTLYILSRNVKRSNGHPAGVRQSNGDVLMSNSLTMNLEGNVYSHIGSKKVGVYDPAQSNYYGKPLVKLDNGAYLHAITSINEVRTIENGTLIGHMGPNGRIMLNGGQTFLTPDASATVEDANGKPIGKFDLAQSNKLGETAFQLTARNDAYVQAFNMTAFSYNGDQHLGALVDAPEWKTLETPEWHLRRFRWQRDYLGSG